MENEITDVDVIEEDKKELMKLDGALPVDIEGMKEEWKRFQEVKNALLDSDRVKYNKWGYIAKPGEEGKDYIIKPGWRKVATAFRLSIDQNISTPQKIWGEDGEGKYYTWLFPIRAIAPNGRYVDSIGVCSSRKPFFSKKGDTRIDPSEEDIVLMAQTVGINRAISDMVGGGEVSGEEMLGKNTEQNQSKLPPPKPAIQASQQQVTQQSQYVVTDKFINAKKYWREYNFSIIDLDTKPETKTSKAGKPYCPEAINLYYFASGLMDKTEINNFYKTITGKTKDFIFRDYITMLNELFIIHKNMFGEDMDIELPEDIETGFTEYEAKEKIDKTLGRQA